MPLGMEVDRDLRDIVFNVDPATPRKKGIPTATQFLAHVYSGQMAGWMMTPRGTEVDLGRGHVVLDGVPAPAKGAQQPPILGPCLLWPRSPISATIFGRAAITLGIGPHSSCIVVLTTTVVEKEVCV